MGTLLVISITGTYSHIAWYKVTFVSIIWMLLLCIAYFILKKAEPLLIKHRNKLLCVFLILFFIILSVFSIISSNVPVNDYGQVYIDSKELVTGGDVYWAYYALFKNNYLLLILMSLIRFPALMLGYEGFYATIIFSTLCATITALLIYRILERFHLSISICFLSLIVFALFAPIWGSTYALYSDQATLIMTVLPFYLITVNNSENKLSNIVRHLIAGLFIGVAFWLKATAVIPMIACLIAVFLFEFNKDNIKRILITIIGFVFFMVCFEFVWQASPASKMTDIHMPPIYWLALGTHGDGGYEENIDYVHTVINTPTLEAKTEYSVAYIKEHFNEVFSLDHIVRKARHNFASGLMGSTMYQYDPTSPAFPFLSAYGTYGGYMMMISTGMLYLLIFLDILGSLLYVIKKQASFIHFPAIVARMSLFGLYLFLMFWEANNRQLHNHIPWMVIVGMLAFSQLFKSEQGGSN